MPFRFKLQKILEYREQLEDQAKIALARTRRLYIEEEGRTEALKMKF